MTLPNSVTIREVGAREGFQTLSQVVPTEQKLELIKRLVSTGVPEIEVASFVRPDRVPQMADAEELVAALEPTDGVRYLGLYLNQRGFERAERCSVLSNVGWLSISACPTFLKNNSNTTLDDLVAAVPSWLALFEQAKKQLHGILVSCAFGSSYQRSISDDEVLASIRRCVEAASGGGHEPTEISLADTMGCGSPELVRRRVGVVRAAFPNTQISLHLHDTRGTGLANAYAGLLEGVDIFDSSVGGLGGCPFAKGSAGNICTEDFAYLCEELGVSTGLDLAAYVEAARYAASVVAEPLPGKLYKTWDAICG